MSAHVLERLSALLDGELPAPERDVVEAHLRTCAACSGHLEVLRAVDAGARALSVPAPPGYFEALPGRVRARLEGAPRPRTFRLPVWTWAVAAALLVAVVTPLINKTPPAARAPEAPSAAEVAPVPSAAAPSASALPDTFARQEDDPSGNLAAPKDETAKGRKKAAAAEPRADRQVPAAEAPRLPEKKELDANTDLREAIGERERSVESAPVRPRAGPGEPSAQQQTQAQAAPAYAPPPPAAPTAESAEALGSARDEGVLEEKLTRGATAGRTSPAVLLSEERSYQRLLAPVSRTLVALRERREAWRSFSVTFPASPRADEARVRVIETGAEAWHLGADPADLARVREDAAAYVARSDAAQGARVRALLESLAADKP